MPQTPVDPTVKIPKSEPSPLFPPSTQRQRLFYILQHSDESFDLDNGIPARQVRSLNVAEFFSLFSRQSQVALDTLDCLTFTISFAPKSDTVVKKGDEVAWGKLKKLAAFMFDLHRHKRKNEDVLDFNVVVEIGDRVSLDTSLESQDDLYGA